MAPDHLSELPVNPAPPRPAVPPPAEPVGNPRADSLNLARRPFGNSRPVVRAAVLLWLLGLALLLGNVYLFRSYLSDSADKRARIARGEEQIAKEQKDIQSLQSRLNGYDLVQLNDRIDFLNTQIDARTFSWSLLLDRIAAVLPNDVRLTRLVPMTGSKAKREVQGGGRSARLGKLREGEVGLSISGVTRSDEALLQFVNHLFAPPFKEPHWTQEQRADDGGNLVKFELTVTYRPGGTPRSAVVVEGTPGSAATPAPGSKAPKRTRPAPAGSASPGDTTPAPGGRP
jgi:Tfp pilus assembly protein PilN